MCTERQLFGGGGGKAPGGGKKRDGGGGGGGTAGGSVDLALLSATQRVFAAFIAPHVPAPAPRLVGCACVFADAAAGGGGACAAPGGGGAAAGPFRLRG